MKLKKLVWQTHKWLALIIGAQVIIWLLSGMILSWLSIDTVKGTDLTKMRHHLPGKSAIDTNNLITTVLSTYFLTHDEVTELKTTKMAGEGYLEVTSSNHGTKVFNSLGKEIAIDQQLVRKIAEDDYRGDGSISEIKFEESENDFFNEQLPHWRVTYNDPRKTTLIISSKNGKLIARRNRFWYLYDFFWMLHIMDYNERENFNTAHIRIISALGGVFAISGLFLIFIVFRKKDFFLWKKRG